VKHEGSLSTTADLEQIELPSRSPFLPDPVIAGIIEGRHESRHADYYRTIASWARYGMRPIDDERARALYAWSAAVFFIDDLVDGWDTDASEIGVAHLAEAQRALIAAVGRPERDRHSDEHLSAETRDAARAVRRASDLCFELRPSDAWWDDYEREMTVFIHGRLVTLFMATHKVWLGPELYLRARVFDIGGNTASVLAGFSRNIAMQWPASVTREVSVLQALAWLHMTAINDLFSYERERDETLFNSLHSVQATASQKHPTSLRQAIDCVVRFSNSLWQEFNARATQLRNSTEGQGSLGLNAYLDELVVNMMGNLEFVQEETTRYSSPTELEGDSEAILDAGRARGHQPWIERTWNGMDPMLQSDPVGRSCSSFVLAGLRAA